LLSIDPKFELRQETLVHAAKSSCFIGVKPGIIDGKPASYATGTAFFVGPDILITAAHVVPDNHRKIVAQLPGTRERTMFVKTLFNHPQEFEVIECKCIISGYPNVDISILQVIGSYRTKDYLDIERIVVKAENQDSVDIIGYPGLYNEEYVQGMHHLPLKWRTVTDFIELFPKLELIITHGTIVMGGMMPTYRLSTVKGMSGAPVIVNGKVIGLYHID
jgi:Trypsin-like peptidase domain